MTDLAWIVALLSPRDIALHPNFRSQEVVTAPSLFALLTTSQGGRFSQERSSEEVPGLFETDPLGMEFVDAVRTAMQVGSVSDGTDSLNRIAVHGPADRPALRVAAAVVASSCYAEVDQVDESVRVLHDLLASELGQDESIRKLLAAIVLTNIALRSRDVGGDSVEPARAASELLASLVPDDLPEVQLSKGVSWGSSTTFANIASLLDESCASHIADADPEFRARVDLVRRAPVTLSQRRFGRAGAAMSKYIQRAFDEVAGTGSRTWSIEGTDGDDELLESLFIAEFSGSPSASYQRTLLGTFRFLEGRSSGQVWQVREGLRLLRQGHSNKHLEPALRLVRSEGPLDVLRAEAIQILKNRTRAGEIGDLEAAVLGAGSDVLGPQTATEGVRRLLSMRLLPTGQRAGRWQHPSSWYEATVRAARQLSASAGLEREVLEEVLGDVEHDRVSEPYDYVVGRMLMGFDLRLWSDEVIQSRARSILENASEWMREIRSALQRQMMLTAPPELAIEVERPLTLPGLASVVDRSLVAGADFPPELMQEAKQVIRSALEQTKTAAANGMFSGRSVSEADVAVALMFLTGDTELWLPVVDYLCDPRVQRDDKTGALNRIVRSPEKVPKAAREALASRVRQLMLGGPTLMGSTIDPYPSALGVAAMLELLPGQELLAMIGTLLGSRTTQVRVEGVQVLAAMAAGRIEHPWLSTSALLLTYDENLAVRASAAYALCLLHDTTQVGIGTVEDRVVALLGTDGVEVPTALLAGIRQSSRTLTPKVRKVLAAMAASHVSRTIRASAGSALGLPED